MYSDIIYDFDIIYNNFVVCEDEYSYETYNIVNKNIPIYLDLINKYNNVSDIFLYERIDNNKTIDISLNDMDFKKNVKYVIC